MNVLRSMAYESGAVPTALVKNTFVFTLCRAPDGTFFEQLTTLIGDLGRSQGCTRYEAAPLAEQANTWVVTGEWDCRDAMISHWNEPPFQTLMHQLRMMYVFSVHFSANGL